MAPVLSRLDLKVTVLGVLAAFTLFVYEASNYKGKRVVQEMVVDNARGETLKARLDVSTLAIPCSILTVNTLDQSGDFNFNLHANLVKHVLDPQGAPTGAVHQPLESEKAAFARGIEAPMFLTENDQTRIKGEIARGEGCRVVGDIVLQKLSGKFHISSNALMLQMLVEAYEGLTHMNTSHVIHQVALGDPYPGSVNPLDRYRRITSSPGSFKYFLNVVPTEYFPLSGKTIHTFQYSVTEYFTSFHDDQAVKLPGIHFKYDMSAIAVKLREQKVGFLHFLTRMCATIGGAFALTSMANSWVDRITSGFR